MSAVNSAPTNLPQDVMGADRELLWDFKQTRQEDNFSSTTSSGVASPGIVISSFRLKRHLAGNSLSRTTTNPVDHLVRFHRVQQQALNSSLATYVSAICYPAHSIVDSIYRGRIWHDIKHNTIGQNLKIVQTMNLQWHPIPGPYGRHKGCIF